MTNQAGGMYNDAQALHAIPEQRSPGQEMHKNTLLQFFVYEYLLSQLQPVNNLFAELAQALEQQLPTNPEKTTAFRKLLEAKDCSIRAILFK